MHQAADNGQYEIAEIILSHKGDPNVQTEEGDTPLHHAAFRGDRKMCKILLDSGADPNTANKTLGRTPLPYAVDYNHMNIVKLLLYKNADPMICDMQEKNAIHYANSTEMQSLIANPPNEIEDPVASPAAPAVNKNYEYSLT